jgi:uncharacterized protein (DUF427 family)
MSFRRAGRPVFAPRPRPGQESVWDYPRPPVLRPDAREVVVRAGSLEVARTTRAIRVLETASPPTFYLPPGDIQVPLEQALVTTWCEWKGQARYWTIVAGDQRIERAAWSYPVPTAPFETIRDYIAFYPARLACWVGGIRVQPQPGGFYGGWITPEVVGPFKGEPGTEGW